MIWISILIGAVPMAVTVYFAQNLLKNQRPVVYYGGLIGAGLLAWQITEWLDRKLRPRLTQMEMDRISHISRMGNRIEELESKYSAEFDNFGEINCEDCGGAIKVWQTGNLAATNGPEQGWCDCQSQSINKR